MFLVHSCILLCPNSIRNILVYEAVLGQIKNHLIDFQKFPLNIVKVKFDSVLINQMATAVHFVRISIYFGTHPIEIGAAASLYFPYDDETN